MSFQKRDLLNHFKALQPVLLALGAEAFVDPCTFVLRIRFGEARRMFYPQFLNFAKGLRQYTPSFNADAKRFVGWSPYFNRRWPLASEKLLFKEFAVRHGILTPEYSIDPAATLADVIVKRSVSSFAGAIKGPFKSSSEHKLDAGAGEYFERFTRGKIAKIWYWNDQPACLELEEMPRVRGNGASTVRELIQAKLFQRGRRRGVDMLQPVLAYFDASLDTVVEKGKHQTVDFRYGSPLITPALARDVDLEADMPVALAPQLRDIGAKLWRGIPEQIRMHTVFTVDAIVDERDRIWALEMNSNPFIHPYVYPVMLKDLFTAKKPNLAGAALQT